MLVGPFRPFSYSHFVVDPHLIFFFFFPNHSELYVSDSLFSSCSRHPALLLQNAVECAKERELKDEKTSTDEMKLFKYSIDDKRRSNWRDEKKRSQTNKRSTKKKPLDSRYEIINKER